MSIISVRDDENNKSKRNAKTKTEKNKGGTSYSEKVRAK